MTPNAQGTGSSIVEISPASGALADALIDLYVRWREECIGVHDAYERWVGAQREDRPAAFAAYSAALDREERAGEVYADLIRRAAPLATDPI